MADPAALQLHREPAVITPADLAAQAVPGQLAVRGDLVVYTLRHVVQGVECTDLWCASVADGAPRPLTRGAGTDCTPRIAPDGSAVAFLRTCDGHPPQPWLLTLSGGDPREIAVFPRGVFDLAWTPDSDALVVLAEDDSSPQVLAGPEGATPTAWLVQRTDWRADGEGLRLHPRHLHRVGVATGQRQRLTSGTWSGRRPRVAADGSVYLVVDRREDVAEPFPQVWLARDGALEQLTNFPGGVVRYHVTPDGLRVLAYARGGRPDGVSPRWYDVLPDQSVRPLPGGQEWWAGQLGEETDLHEWALELDDAPGVSTVSSGGSTTPFALDAGRRLVLEPVVCGAIAADGASTVAVLGFGDGRYAPDVYALDARVLDAKALDANASESAAARRLTEHGDWLRAFAPPRSSSLEYAGPAGPIAVHLLRPPEGVPDRGTVLALHGGPTGQWSSVPTLEALLLAGAGHTVAMPNIRGSIDQGPGWVAALRGAWGEADAADVAAVCDGLARDGLVPDAGLGVTGLSYGGFLTLWMIGTTGRFAAAVSENGVANQVSAWANCDTGPAFCRSAGLGDPLSADGVERLWASSPLRHVATVRTPLLMLQAAEDRICPAADNEQFFIALRALGRPVSYVLYPEEGHLMQATGRLDRRIDRHRRVIAWFDRYLAR